MAREPVHFEPLDAEDPAARMGEVNPVLSEAQIARVASFGEVTHVPAGTTLFRRGSRGRDFLLVLSGGIEMLDLDEHGEERLLLVYGPGQFPGEFDLFADLPVLVTGRAGEDTDLVRVARADFHRMLSAEPELAELMMRAFILRRVGLVRHHLGGAVVVGPAHGKDTIRVERFLIQNSYPHRVVDTEAGGEAAPFIAAFAPTPAELPIVIDICGRVHRNPSNAALADALGMTESIPADHVYDVAVVGAGPAGLAAAVYSASEGLDTIVIEGAGPGGQAGTSSKIENYLGFPLGISGLALAARAQVQALKFGAKFALAREVFGLDCEHRPYRLFLEGDRTVLARALVVATGARYRTLAVPGYQRFEGRGIHYAATAMEAALCANQDAVVVGAGNSAGQAALVLARSARHVHVLVRREGLAATMARYLVARIDASPRITVHPRTEISALEGDEMLREVTWRSAAGEVETHRVENVFAMIGADPRTEWLGPCLALDDKGFVLTGRPVAGRELLSPFETSHEGIFAVGDVRSGSVKRVASSVGEGSVVVQAIHRFLDPSLAQ